MPDRKTARMIFAVGFLAFFSVSAGSLSAQSRGGFNDLPIRVRMVLTKVSPLMQEKNYGKAAEILEKFRAEGKPDKSGESIDGRGYNHPEVCFFLGNCYLMMGKYEQAADAYRDSVKKDPGRTSAWLNLARAAYETKQLFEAGRCFTKAYETSEDKKPDHLYNSALSYLMAGDHDLSLERFRWLQNNHPSAMKPEWKENLVHALLSAGRPRKALPHIRELASIYTGKKQRQWQEILLYQYVQLEMKKKALDLAMHLTQSAPTVEKWWKALANIHLNEGRYEEALAALIIYSFLETPDRTEKKLLADLSLEVGIPVKAAPIYEGCLKESADKAMLKRLVYAYRQLGRPEKALERIRAFPENSGEADLILLSAELYYTLEQYEQAASAYRRAAGEKGDHQGRAWLMAGYSAWQSDNFTESRQAFKRAAEYGQQKKSALKALEELKKVMNKQ